MSPRSNPIPQPPLTPMEPKPRPLRVPIHILAYFGDYMTQFEESIKRLANQAAQEKKADKYKTQSNTQKPLAQFPVDQ